MKSWADIVHKQCHSPGSVISSLMSNHIHSSLLHAVILPAHHLSNLQEVGNVAAFLCSPLASAVTGHVMYVDNGLNVMGLAVDSKTLERVE